MHSASMGTQYSGLDRPNSWRGHRPDLKLGQGDPQVVVDISVANTYLYPASITLLDSSKEPHEELITIRPDPDESIIDGTWKIPAKGYGKSILESVCDKYGYDLLNGNSEAARAIVDEMALVASANAQTIAKSLVRNKPVGMDTTLAQPAFAIKYVTERRQILRAAKFLFDRPELEDEEISVYHTSTPLHQNTPLPSSVAGALQVARRNTQEWNANFGNPWSRLFRHSACFCLHLPMSETLTNAALFPYVARTRSCNNTD